MSRPIPPQWLILIVSHHPVFGAGMRSLLQGQGAASVELLQHTTNTQEIIDTLSQLRPAVVILDYDDATINRDEFLARFVESEQPMRVVLVSLKGAGPVVLYDRRTLAVSQVEDWVKEILPDPPNNPPSDDASRAGRPAGRV